MSMMIILDSAIMTAMGRGQEPECFLAGADAVKRLDKDVEQFGLMLSFDTVRRGVRTYRMVPVIECRSMKPDSLELVARPFAGAPEITLLL